MSLGSRVRKKERKKRKEEKEKKEKGTKDTRVRLFAQVLFVLAWLLSFYSNIRIRPLKRDIANNAARYVGLSIVDSRVGLL